MQLVQQVIIGNQEIQNYKLTHLVYVYHVWKDVMHALINYHVLHVDQDIIYFNHIQESIIVNNVKQIYLIVLLVQ